MVNLKRIGADNFCANFVRHVRRQLRLAGCSRADDKETASHRSNEPDVFDIRPNNRSESADEEMEEKYDLFEAKEGFSEEGEEGVATETEEEAEESSGDEF